MAAGKGKDAAPIFIKKVSGGEEGGHHGGAWKVAYADFVTAMMAFFLLMWLLNATTEKQRQGLADYFNPTVIQSPDSSAANDMFDGEDFAADRERVLNGVGAMQDEPSERNLSAGQQGADTVSARAEAEFTELARHVQNALTGSGAESMQRINILRHVVTRMTDEGLVIELTDLTGESLFVDDTAQPTPALRELSEIVARALGQVKNDVAVQGHVRAYPEMLVQSPVWPLSDARAHTVRNLMEQAGLAARKVQRVTGFADRRNRSSNPMDPNNNRIEVILLK